MRIPKQPPNYIELFKRVAPQRVVEVLSQQASPTVGDRYIHWEKLAYHKPPGNLTIDEWWVALKLRRQSAARMLPMTSKDGTHFSFVIPDTALEYLHFIDQGLGGRIESSSPELASSTTRDSYLVHSLVEEAISSSQLEGAVTTRVVAKEMIRLGRKPLNESEQMIHNNYEAMQWIRQKRGRPLSLPILLELHSVLTDRTLPSESVGRLRKPHEHVAVFDQFNEVLHQPPPAEQLEGRLAALIDFANGLTPGYFIHPVLRAIILHFWLAYEHPFVDGNGRCARALFYWSMLREGAWLCEFLSISQIIRKAHAKYGMAFLFVETDANDLTYFILYHLNLLRQAIEALHRYIAIKSQEISETHRLIRQSQDLNHRQVALLNHALRHPDADYTIASHRTSHNVTIETARKDLLELHSRGLLAKHKRGRAFVFRPAKALEKTFRKG